MTNEARIATLETEALAVEAAVREELRQTNGDELEIAFAASADPRVANIHAEIAALEEEDRIALLEARLAHLHAGGSVKDMPQ